ncbi:hypothetical protein FTO74_00725 [Granulicella sp. WH15]|uniref:hypothetical protein n=1 Tax=Granulicella sp. WH15 TaxID=2602070 RepID=UPI00136776F8|nr:hypothetical protein [Granulicella sp. WH15]QHN02066.1 hypothetical protein FTO74_00725 [Granulicella sp. WH15]
MPILIETAPASVRMMPAGLRDPKGLGAKTAASAEARAHLVHSVQVSRSFREMEEVREMQSSRFARMPHEPEDARITGVTRSLTRRLLALNLSGSLRPMPVRSVERVTQTVVQVA